MSRKTTKAKAATWTGALAALGLALAAAAPAQAGRFGDGFEDELGRIAAHAAVGAGVHLIHHAVAPHYVETHVSYGRDYRPRYERPRHHYKGHYKPHHKRHYKPHHGYGHGRGHGYGRGHGRHHGSHYRGGPACNVDHRVTVERRTRYSRSRH